ncbi:uncharacterized protein LOC120082447 isoform X1 [Benincasa hispida]|uniref:uncharacterized protein LOC120082447 isoform X1 n=1 Tax=Benincasa hispida TaxID=102211 RepID=UPI0019022016|nr:uncharacterized protein LOC120082447 isoform X1 [Benincasa hispida]
MGKRDKKQKHHDGHSRRRDFKFTSEGEVMEDGDFNSYPLPSPSARELEEDEEEVEEEEEEQETTNESSSMGIPSKFQLYQQSVQSPKGDISYLQKFFLMYVGGRQPIHLQEDFCGTALLSLEWLRSDSRRTAVGLDLDLEALVWCMENNFNRTGADVYSRISLFHGNVLNPSEARLVNPEPREDLIENLTLEDSKDNPKASASESIVKEESASFNDNEYLKRNITLDARDIVCAFNYSCCCLHSRADLVTYFKHARASLSRKGGIFVMDLYGGTSSEQKLKLQRKFANFKAEYIWEQAEFDIIGRKTRISLHFDLKKQQKKLRHAFSYSWRLVQNLETTIAHVNRWSLPEIKDCLEEAGFRSVHFWIRQMPDTEEIKSIEGFGAGSEVKYEEVETFQQKDSWNAYIVGVL